MKRMLCGGLCLLITSSAVVADHDEAYALRREGQILPLETILQNQQQIQPGRVLEVELEREHGAMVYELEVLDERGTVWQLQLDATSGELIEREIED